MANNSQTVFKEDLQFPIGFLWGTATSAHQIEGNNNNSDWWKWENEMVGVPNGPRERSGNSCDSYNRYEEDFSIIKSLNQNAHRLSIEWARIQPDKDFFSEEAVNHYRSVLKELKNAGIKTFVTLHHFTNPIWFSNLGGWENKNSSQYFCKYVEHCVKNFSDLVDSWITINEPTVYSNLSFLIGIWVPNKKNIFSAIKVFRNLSKAHKAAYVLIKQYDSEARVGFAHQVVRFSAYSNIIFDKVCAFLMNKLFLSFVIGQFKLNDFLAINYYVETKLKWLKPMYDFSNGITDMGWPISAKGLYEILLDLSKWQKEIYITENGVAVSDDSIRKSFIVEHLLWIKRAINKGVKIKGYFYWSLLDNFEWDKGFSMKFGLVEVDRQNGFKRNIRESGFLYSEISRNNGLTFLKNPSYSPLFSHQLVEENV